MWGERNGSPLIALHAEGEFTDYFFVEKRRDSFQSLEKHVNEHPLASKVSLQRGDFNELVPQILSQIPDLAPTLFFLDPEGLELDFETVRLISQRTKADVFILISGSGVIRKHTHSRITRSPYSLLWWRRMD